MPAAQRTAAYVETLRLNEGVAPSGAQRNLLPPPSPRGGPSSPFGPRHSSTGAYSPPNSPTLLPAMPGTHSGLVAAWAQSPASPAGQALPLARHLAAVRDPARPSAATSRPAPGAQAPPLQGSVAGGGIPLPRGADQDDIVGRWSPGGDGGGGGGGDGGGAESLDWRRSRKDWLVSAVPDNASSAPPGPSALAAGGRGPAASKAAPKKSLSGRLRNTVARAVAPDLASRSKEGSRAVAEAERLRCELEEVSAQLGASTDATASRLRDELRAMVLQVDRTTAQLHTNCRPATY